MTGVRYAVLIPARLGSTRLPEKVLLDRSGKYLVQHVVERALEAPGSPQVVVLTDDDRVVTAVRSFGGEVLLTRPDHPSGTDRCAEAAEHIDADVFVNLQADEPLIEPVDLARLAEAAAAADTDLATLGHPFTDEAMRGDPNAVKAIVGADGFALDFSREAPDPEPAGSEVLHHLGLYAWRRGRLLAFTALAPSPREQAERLEQLRAVEDGWRIRVLRSTRPAFGIDTPEDYEAFLREIGRIG